MDELIQKSGGFRKLVSFRVAVLTYDVTLRFCDQFIRRGSRTHDQMVQAARSGAQNIAEGSLASATSKKTELKLTGVARASLGELIRDYEDFLRQNRLSLWVGEDGRRQGLLDRRFKTVDQVERWATEFAAISTPSTQSTPSTPSSQPSSLPECWANAGHALSCVAFGLLSRQLKSLARAFQENGGFTERLYRTRKQQQQSWRS
ncbi:MAG: four helix bundle suffix domain-containing protein [Myxococcales bacterium]